MKIASGLLATETICAYQAQKLIGSLDEVPNLYTPLLIMNTMRVKVGRRNASHKKQKPYPMYQKLLSLGTKLHCSPVPVPEEYHQRPLNSPPSFIQGALWRGKRVLAFPETSRLPAAPAPMGPPPFGTCQARARKLLCLVPPPSSGVPFPGHPKEIFSHPPQLPL